MTVSGIGLTVGLRFSARPVPSEATQKTRRFLTELKARLIQDGTFETYLLIPADVLKQPETGDLNPKELRSYGQKLGFNIISGAEARKRALQDPEVQERRTAGVRQSHQRPEVKALLSRKAKEYLATPEAREKRCQQSQQLAQDPEWRQKVSDGVKEALASPEVRRRMSETSIRVMSDPDVRRKLSERLKAIFNTPEEQARRRETTQRAWADPEKRGRMLAGLHRVLEDESFRQRRAEASRLALQDPEVRDRISQGIRKALDTPEARARLSRQMKRAWQDPVMRQKLLEGRRDWQAQQPRRPKTQGTVNNATGETIDIHDTLASTALETLIDEEEAAIKQAHSLLLQDALEVLQDEHPMAYFIVCQRYGLDVAQESLSMEDLTLEDPSKADDLYQFGVSFIREYMDAELESSET